MASQVVPTGFTPVEPFMFLFMVLLPDRSYLLN